MSNINSGNAVEERGEPLLKAVLRLVADLPLADVDGAHRGGRRRGSASEGIGDVVDEDEFTKNLPVFVDVELLLRDGAARRT